ncbi:MAG: hypothetical protein KAJ32_09845 [Gammaproteobacteria bacterium]|nr:hypothetical protein [Gammaproteobacteria bacterium]
MFLTALLISCTTPGKQIIEDDLAEGRYKFAAWRLDNSREFEAINKLLGEVDGLIEANSLDAAEDKLERVLRIKSGYAPAWSRLSWMALETNSPKRAVQMAKRSNSFAHGNRELQSLNWSFIRDASQALNDEQAYIRAGQKIDSLQSF